jgi:hypothetical protein
MGHFGGWLQLPPRLFCYCLKGLNRLLGSRSPYHNISECRTQRTTALLVFYLIKRSWKGGKEGPHEIKYFYILHST